MLKISTFIYLPKNPHVVRAGFCHTARSVLLWLHGVTLGLKLLAHTGCGRNSFLYYLQSKGQATWKIISGPIKLAKTPAAGKKNYGLPTSWITAVIWMDNLQPPPFCPLRSRVLQKLFAQLVCYFILIKSTGKEQQSAFCSVFEWQEGREKKKKQRKPAGSVWCPPEENQIKCCSFQIQRTGPKNHFSWRREL